MEWYNTAAPASVKLIICFATAEAPRRRNSRGLGHAQLRVRPQAISPPTVLRRPPRESLPKPPFPQFFMHL